MGLFDFLKKQKLSSADINIDITNHIATINGSSIPVPCQLDELTKIFGKARRFEGGAGNLNYVWDELGIYCYVTAGLKVYCIAIKKHKSAQPMPFEASGTYKGVLTICGENWEEVMSKGNDLEIARERSIDGLSLFAEYTDFEYGDRNGCSNAYAGIEIKLI